MMLMVPQLKRLMVPLPMMIMVLRVLLIMTMLRAQLLLILMVPQLKSLILPQHTAMLPDVDVPDLATLADLPQLDLTETETVQHTIFSCTSLSLSSSIQAGPWTSPLPSVK